MTNPRKPQIDLDLDYIDKLKAIGMSDKSIPDVTFTFADYQCLERLMNVRDITVEDDLKEYLRKLYEQDNEAMCKNIAEIVANQNRLLFDTLKAQSDAIKSIAKDVSETKKDIATTKEDVAETRKEVRNISERLIIIEKRTEVNETTIKSLDNRLIAERQRIEELEKRVEALRPSVVNGYLDEMKVFKCTVEKLIKTQSWWNISLRIAIAVAISLLLVAIFM